MTKKTQESGPIAADDVAAKIIPTSATAMLRTKNLAYMLYSVMSRAVPLATSGVKPGQQRMLVSMLADKVVPGSKPRKSAKLTSAATGAYHPHGQAAMYGAMVTLTTTYARVPLIDGIGSFGMVPGDAPAADRYTEARLGVPGYEMVREITAGAVPMRPTYDGENTEPMYLPVRFPVLPCVGAEGVGEGWATRTPAHNPREVMAAAAALLDNPDLTVDELMEIMPGPDWGTGGEVIGDLSGIRDYYATGQGRITVRGVVSIEGKSIILTQLPPGVRAPTLLDGTPASPGIREKARQSIIPGIADVSDLSDLDKGLHVVITVKRGADPKEVLAALYRETPLESTYAASMVALSRDFVPKWWSMLDLLREFLSLRDDVVRRRSASRLDKVRELLSRARALAAVVLDKEDAARIILDAEDKAAAAAGIGARFELDEGQSTYIVEMPLHRLTKADAIEAVKRCEALESEAADLQRLIDVKEARDVVVAAELEETAHIFDDPVYDRRTVLRPDVAPVGGTVDLPDDEKLASWRLDAASGMLGESGDAIAAGDNVWSSFTDGRVKLFGGKGLPKVMRLTPVAPDISALLACGTLTPGVHDLLLVSRAGRALRLSTDPESGKFNPQGVAGNGVAGLRLDDEFDGDVIVGAHPVTDDDVLLTLSDLGWKATRVSEIPAKGRGTGGVVVHRLTTKEAGVHTAAVGAGFTVNGAPAKPTARTRPSSHKVDVNEWEVVAP